MIQKEIITELMDKSQYDSITDYLKKEGVKLTVIRQKYGRMDWDDTKTKRMVFTLKLTYKRRQYTFDFGQSIAKGGETPTLYAIMACLQKYEIETFEDFCDMCGYNTYSKSADKAYKAVCKEYNAMARLFTNDELEALNEII